MKHEINEALLYNRIWRRCGCDLDLGGSWSVFRDLILELNERSMIYSIDYDEESIFLKDEIMGSNRVGIRIRDRRGKNQLRPTTEDTLAYQRPNTFIVGERSDVGLIVYPDRTRGRDYSQILMIRKTEEGLWKIEDCRIMIQELWPNWMVKERKLNNLQIWDTLIEKRDSFFTLLNDGLWTLGVDTQTLFSEQSKDRANLLMWSIRRDSKFITKLPSMFSLNYSKNGFNLR